LLLSSTSWAAVVNVHFPVPTIRVSVPTVHVAAPIVHVKAPAIKTAAITTNQSTWHHDLQKITNRSTTHHDLQEGDGERRGYGTSASTISYRGTPVNFQSSLALNRHGDLPKSGRNGGRDGGRDGNAPVPTSPPAGLYSPDCNGAADCPGPSGPVTPVSNLPNQVSFPEPTLFPFEFGPTELALALAAEQEAQAAAAALQIQVQGSLGNINYELGLLTTQLTIDENELSTLSGELNQAQECSAPSSQVQCPSLSAAQLEQEITILKYDIASITWAIGTLQDLVLGVVVNTASPSPGGGYTQQTASDLLNILVAAGSCVLSARYRIELMGSLPHGFPPAGIRE
jgi:hypothetical protein